MVPPPHVTVQAPHSDHELTSQLTSHGCALQACVSVSCGHSVPPLCGVWVTVRTRWLVPPSGSVSLAQSAVQLPQLLHAVTSQCTGQGAILQSSCSVSGGHDEPPNSGVVMMVRSRDWIPPAHAAEHKLQSLHADTTQFTSHSACVAAPHAAHSSVLHAMVSVPEGHISPPCSAATCTVRVRSLIPPPQLAEHPSHEPHPFITQSMGHA